MDRFLEILIMIGLNSVDCSIRVYLVMAAMLIVFQHFIIGISFLKILQGFLLIPYAKTPTSGSVKDTILKNPWRIVLWKFHLCQPDGKIGSSSSKLGV